MLLSLEADQVKEMVKNFGLKDVQYAINESIIYNKPSFAYLRGILKRKQNEKALSSTRTNSTENKVRRNDKEGEGLVPFECEEISCGNLNYIQRKMLAKAAQSLSKIPCTKCGAKHSAENILTNAKVSKQI